MYQIPPEGDLMFYMPNGNFSHDIQKARPYKLRGAKAFLNRFRDLCHFMEYGYIEIDYFKKGIDRL